MASELGRRDLIVGGVAGLVAGGRAGGGCACGGRTTEAVAGGGQVDAGRSCWQRPVSAWAEHQHDSRAEALDRRGDRARTKGRLPGDGALDRRAGTVCRSREGRSRTWAKRFRDAGISVESAIGFFDWVVDDPERRRKGFESARRAMDLVRRIGGKRLAAPPVGATDRRMADMLPIAERYRSLLELGDQDRRGSPGGSLGWFEDAEPAG